MVGRLRREYYEKRQKNNSGLKSEFSGTYKQFINILKKEIKETKEYYAEYNRKLHLQKLEKGILKKLISLINRMHKAGLKDDVLVQKAHKALAVMKITLNMQHKIADLKRKCHNKAASTYKKSKRSIEEFSNAIYEKEKLKLSFT